MATLDDSIDAIYQRASRKLGRPEVELRCMGVLIFATMLHHSMDEPGKTINTLTRFTPGSASADGSPTIEIECNVPLRRRPNE